MANLGRKYSCYSCHSKFYDLGKATPICPKCGADQRDADDAPVVTSHRARRVAPVPEPEVVEEEAAPALTDAEEDEDFEALETEEEAEEEEEEDGEY